MSALDIALVVLMVFAGGCVLHFVMSIALLMAREPDEDK
jgi:hypothetical protein